MGSLSEEGFYQQLNAINSPCYGPDYNVKRKMKTALGDVDEKAIREEVVDEKAVGRAKKVKIEPQLPEKQPAIENGLSEMPAHLMSKIGEYLPAQDILNLNLVNQELKSATQHLVPAARLALQAIETMDFKARERQSRLGPILDKAQNLHPDEHTKFLKEYGQMLKEYGRKISGSPDFHKTFDRLLEHTKGLAANHRSDVLATLGHTIRLLPVEKRGPAVDRVLHLSKELDSGERVKVLEGLTSQLDKFYGEEFTAVLDRLLKLANGLDEDHRATMLMVCADRIGTVAETKRNSLFQSVFRETQTLAANHSASVLAKLGEQIDMLKTAAEKGNAIDNLLDRTHQLGVEHRVQPLAALAGRIDAFPATRLAAVHRILDQVKELGANHRAEVIDVLSGQLNIFHSRDRAYILQRITLMQQPAQNH